MDTSIFSASSVIIILALMLIISLRLYISRRKLAYFSFSISIVFAIIPNLVTIFAQIQSSGETELYAYVHRFLQTVSFILINMGIYQLYNRTRRKNMLFLVGTTLVSIMLFFIFLPSRLSLGMDLFLLLLIFCVYHYIPRYIGQTGKFLFSLLLFFIMHVSHIVNHYFFFGEARFLMLLEQFLPIVFYSVLFTFLFERVVELLQAVYRSSITDGLTSLYSRQFFDKRVTQYLSRQMKIGIVFVDIDNFKQLNDTRGHQYGDVMLKKVAMIMMEEADEVGIAGRYGGEELVMLVIDPAHTIRHIAERVRKRVELESEVTVSVGYSIARGKMQADTLIEQADQAMYASKTTGKNKVTGYSIMKSKKNTVL